MTRTITICWVFALSAFSTPAFSGEQTIDSAKQAFQSGVEALKQEDFSKALTAFETSNRLRPKPVVRYNIGLCQHALSKYVEAIETLELLMAESSETLSAERRIEVEQILAVARARVATLRLRTGTEGAEILIDGRLLPEDGEETVVTVNPGDHVVEMRKIGFISFRKEMTVDSGTTLQLEIPALAPVSEADGTTPPAAVPSASPAADGVDGAEKKSKDPSTTYGSTPPPGDAPTTRGRDDVGRFLFVASIAGVSVGVACLVLGGVFTYRWHQDFDALTRGDTLCKESWQPNCLDYHDRYADRMIVDEAVLITGFAVGGTLMAAGAALFSVYYVRKKKSADTLAITPLALSVFF